MIRFVELNTDVIADTIYRIFSDIRYMLYSKDDIEGCITYFNKSNLGRVMGEGVIVNIDPFSKGWANYNTFNSARSSFKSQLTTTVLYQSCVDYCLT
jgi:hypothetical protein